MKITVVGAALIIAAVIVVALVISNRGTSLPHSPEAS